MFVFCFCRIVGLLSDLPTKDGLTFCKFVNKVRDTFQSPQVNRVLAFFAKEKKILVVDCVDVNSQTILPSHHHHYHHHKKT